MVGRQSIFFVVDNSGAKTACCINIYKGVSSAHPGSLLSVSIRRCKLISKLKKGQVFRGVVVQLNQPLFRNVGHFVRFNKNAIVLLKKLERTPIATRITKCILKEVRDCGFNRVAALSLGLFLKPTRSNYAPLLSKKHIKRTKAIMSKKKDIESTPEFSEFLENFLVEKDFDSVETIRPPYIEENKDLDVFDKRDKKKISKKKYGENIDVIKEAFRRSKLSEFVQRRLRSMDLHKAIYEDFALDVPSLPTSISKDFFKIGWSEEFYYHIISYDLVHEGVLDRSRMGIHEFLFPYNKRIIMEIAIPIDYEAEYNMHKAYCFLRSFSEPTFESRMTFSNFDAVCNKLRHFQDDDSSNNTKFFNVSVSFRHYQFFQMLGCLFRILEEVKNKGVEHSIIYVPETNSIEITIKNIGELDLDDLKFDYFLWKHPLRFIVKNMSYHTFKYFNFFLTFLKT